MSAVQRSKASWLAQSYEKLVLVVLLVALLLSAVYLAVRVGQLRKSLSTQDWERPDVEPRAVEPVDMQALEGRLAALDKPFQAEPRKEPLLVSEMRVACVACGKPIPYTADPCPFCGEKQPEGDPRKLDSDGDLMNDDFELKYGLNPYDPSDAQLDMDGDGFTNLDEYLAGTSPADPKDFPSPAAKLRVVRVITHPFKLRFQGVSSLEEGDQVFLLNMRGEKSHFVRIGDQVEGWEIVGYEPNIMEGPYGPVDESVLTVKSGSDVMRLVKNKDLTGQERTAYLVLLLDGSTFQVRQDDTIKIKDLEYKIVEIGRESVKIREVQSGKETVVGRLSEGERMSLTQPRESQETPGRPSSYGVPGVAHPGFGRPPGTGRTGLGDAPAK